jgi:hypothetical protein
VIDPERTNVSWPIRVLTGTAFILFSSIFVWQMTKKNLYSLPSISELEKLYSEIRLPEDARKLENTSISNRITVQSVYSRYTTSLSAENVGKFFNSELTSAGWKLVENRAPSTERAIARYCRSGINIVIETSRSTSGGVNFFLGVSRGNEPEYGWSCP